MTHTGEAYTIGVVMFDGFELLDAYGPLEMLGEIPSVDIVMLGPSAGYVSSAQSPRTVIDTTYENAPPLDLLLVPGGPGTRRLVKDEAVLTWVGETSKTSQIIGSVCTGAAVLAAAGVLDGYKATTNKQAFGWVADQGPGVEWIRSARWVHDRNRWTSSGVSAGIDMSLAIVAHVLGEQQALVVADEAEYEWHEDSTRDPFAIKSGLV